MSSDMDRERRIVVLGDSIVAGWGIPQGGSYPTLLEKWLNEEDKGTRYSVVNAGIPGDTVIGGCLRYERDVRAHTPDTLLIAFGLNDGAVPRTPYDVQCERRWRAQHSPQERSLLCQQEQRAWQRLEKKEDVWSGQQKVEPRVAPKVFFAGLSDLIRRGRRDGADIHLLSLTPVSKQKLSTDQWRRYVLYDNIIREVARCHGVPLIDLIDAEKDPFVHASMLAEDGIHLLAAGQEWLARQVYAHLMRERRRE